MMGRSKVVLWAFLALFGAGLSEKSSYLASAPKSTPDGNILLASTIMGELVALDGTTGDILWKLDDEPVVKSPYDSDKPVLPAFLPDPKDGSIYMIGGGIKDPLKKLPFTIQELVAASPCKSSDGILYTGKKVDTWFSVDKWTGTKIGSISPFGCQGANINDELTLTCPSVMNSDVFLIGRTEYNIIMYDGRVDGEPRHWNISFFDYTTNTLPGNREKQKLDYEMAHFTDSSTGSLATFDRQTGYVEWKAQVDSPIVGMYKLEGGGIAPIPFTSVSKETLNNLLTHFSSSDMTKESIGETKLFPTLYVGEYSHGLYAMPSLVDQQTLTIAPTSEKPLLLEGPEPGSNYLASSEQEEEDNSFQIPPKQKESEKSSALFFEDELDFGIFSKCPKLFKKESKKSRSDLANYRFHQFYNSAKRISLTGYYKVPGSSQVYITPARAHPQLTSLKNGKGSGSYVRSGATAFKSNRFNDKLNSERDDILNEGLKQIGKFNTTWIFSTRALHFVGQGIYPVIRNFFADVENKELKLIIFILILSLVYMYRTIQRHLPFTSSALVGGFSYSSVGSNASTSSTSSDVVSHPIDLGDGNIKIGNILFNQYEILGKGCEGTFVYKGMFDNRKVAVKRVLAACFSIADREVHHLRESDEHPNVVRYFCMEQDRQFRYIALELCAGNLQDVVEGKLTLPVDDSSRYLNLQLLFLRQATQGLQHLHSLDIVHRDIKPHNILISLPNKKGEVRALISDFGLCKKLKVGRMSFSRRSGITGTEGWIAPEIMLGNKSTTTAVDIFSLGCAYYYVLSKGNHPFGESFKRQANILAGEVDLNHLSDDDYEAKTLIRCMLSTDINVRPSCNAILKHPIFWSKEKILAFFQDVSDRVDKEGYDSVILASLERNRFEVINGNWHNNLDPLIQEDLRKHRSYNGKCIRDLLRALRNKKHHYQELPSATKMLFGRVPDKFSDYWTKRFPKLLIHVWHSMHCIKREPTFIKYFEKEYDFLQHLSEEEIILVPESRRSVYKSQLLVRPLSEKQNFFEPSFINEKTSSVISRWSNHDEQEIFKNFERVKEKGFTEDGEFRSENPPHSLEQEAVPLSQNDPFDDVQTFQEKTFSPNALEKCEVSDEVEGNIWIVPAPVEEIEQKKRKKKKKPKKT